MSHEGFGTFLVKENNWSDTIIAFDWISPDCLAEIYMYLREEDLKIFWRIKIKAAYST